MAREQVAPENYADETCRQFVRDMIDAGLAPYHYRGRHFWEGPAVDVDDPQEAQSTTRVKCQRDGMGLGYVVYPRDVCDTFQEAPQPIIAADDDELGDEDMGEEE